MSSQVPHTALTCSFTGSSHVSETDDLAPSPITPMKNGCNVKVCLLITRGLFLIKIVNILHKVYKRSSENKMYTIKVKTSLAKKGWVTA